MYQRFDLFVLHFAGTIFFLGPEIYDGHYTAKADVFSLGLIFAAIICYDRRTHDGLYVAIVQNGHHIAPGEALREDYEIDPLLRPTVPLPSEVRSLIMRMLRKTPKLRPTADEVEQVMWDATKDDDASRCIVT